jgi:hypothetical protein
MDITGIIANFVRNNQGILFAETILHKTRLERIYEKDDYLFISSAGTDNSLRKYKLREH